MIMVHPQSARAAQESITITPLSPLRFGSFVVISTGARTISHTGAVTNTSIFPVPGDASGPATFELAYDRGNNAGVNGANAKPLTIQLELMLLPVQPVNSGGVSGSLDTFTTDLPGVPVLQPGVPTQIAIENCVTRVCRQAFRVGGRIAVSRVSGGATLAFSLPLTATLLP